MDTFRDAPQFFKNLWSSVINRTTSLFKYSRGEESPMMKGEMCMNTIQVRIDFDTKLQLISHVGFLTFIFLGVFKVSEVCFPQPCDYIILWVLYHNTDFAILKAYL